MDIGIFKWKKFETNLPADYDAVNLAAREKRIKEYLEEKAKKDAKAAKKQAKEKTKAERKKSREEKRKT